MAGDRPIGQARLLLDIGPDQGSERDERYTPKSVFDTLGITFDLDVCAPAGGVPWVPAARYFTLADDGLSQPWEGRVWMNPPYSNATPWVRRFIEHANGICLVGHAKSAWHPELWAAADACAIPRYYFDFVGGSIFMPVWFAAFGDECVGALHNIGVTRIRSEGGAGRSDSGRAGEAQAVAEPVEHTAKPAPSSGCCRHVPNRLDGKRCSWCGAAMPGNQGDVDG